MRGRRGVVVLVIVAAVLAAGIWVGSRAIDEQAAAAVFSGP